MGSASITETFWTTDSAQSTYDRAVERDRDEYGNRGSVRVPRRSGRGGSQYINDVHNRRVVGDAFESQAAARAAAIELARSGKVLTTLTIIAKVIRATDEPLVTIEPVLASSTFEVTVSIVGPSPKPGVRAGWMFVGWAAS